MKSEFGKGFIYNLMLFLNHFSNSTAEGIRNKQFVINKSSEERALILCDNPDGTHSYGFNKDVKWWFETIVPIYGSPKAAIQAEITTWANGASDHLYELEIPEKWKETPIGQKASWIRDFGLDMGHGRGLMEHAFTWENFIELQKAVFELAMLIDKELGLEPIEAEYK